METTTKKFTIDEIKLQNKANGFFFFEPKTMRFFNSRIANFVFQGNTSVFFVSSEKEPDGVRRYSVRVFDIKTAGVSTVAEFGAFPTLTEAKAAAQAKAIMDGGSIKL